MLTRILHNSQDINIWFEDQLFGGCPNEMQGDFQWHLDLLSIRELKQCIDLLATQGPIIHKHNISVLAYIYVELILWNEGYLVVKNKGWDTHPDILMLLESKKELDEQWKKLEKQISKDVKLKVLRKDLSIKLKTYERHTGSLSRFIYEERLNLLGIRDSIEILLQIIAKDADVNDFQERIDQADKLLKEDFQRDHRRFTFIEDNRNRLYISRNRWWWYIDQLA